jgi:hypothetical protein
MNIFDNEEENTTINVHEHISLSINMREGEDADGKIQWRLIVKVDFTCSLRLKEVLF